MSAAALSGCANVLPPGELQTQTRQLASVRQPENSVCVLEFDRSYICVAKIVLMLSNMPDETVFEVDPFWAKPCRAYHVQHEPDQANIRQITEFQDHIEATSAGELHRMPVLSLHMTVLTLRSATASVAPGAEALWSQHKEKWLERIGDVCSSTRPVAIELNSIRATRGAIILSGDESEDLKQFREQLVAAVSLPDWNQHHPISPIYLFFDMLVPNFSSTRSRQFTGAISSREFN
jgi:hypothetical protein